MKQKFENKVAIITGGSSGIGRASALAFAQEGAKIVVADIDIEGGAETVYIVERAGGEGIFINTDVSNATSVQAMIDKTVKMYGRLDYAHNNAGIGPKLQAIADYTEEDWDHIISINLKGVWLCMKYEIPHMLRQRKGAIVNTASMFGLIGKGRRSAYCASKHGVIGMTRASAQDYASEGIRINAILPGVIPTPMTLSTWDGQPDAEVQTIAMQPMKRLGTVEEVAAVVVWLCSDAASFVNGHAMAVDGGLVGI